MYTVVLVTRTRWTELPRIRHQLARQLARFYRVLFVETPVYGEAKTPTRVEEVEKNIIRCSLGGQMSLPVKLQHYFPPAHRIMEKLWVKEIHRVLQGYGEYPLILFNFNYDFMEIMNSDKFVLKIYFCNDDFPAMVNNSISRRIVWGQQHKTASRADLCLAVSYPLVEALKKSNGQTRLFLPGHDLKELKSISAVRPKGSKIRLSFMGYIGNRLEFEWLLEAAAQPDMEVHLVGPLEEIDPGLMERLTQQDSLHIHPPMFDEPLNEILETMDVLVIPYKISFQDVLAITAPNKFFKYLALGKPVVISNMPHFIQFSEGVIYRADSAEAFVKQVRTAFQEDSPEKREQRFKISEENTWDKRGLEIKQIIEDIL
ncbi:glycosyltransferase [Candidatus Contubernalis alkaliaceticus]|uniref:glycosyltransferase n=1 Tax=Candidatus Contubernalis alkaliaceticus TaxID=338645 RepID=UPI001F4BE34C|nr:glycosyltransferase [Candidatus Contubernalis alkalaceticus]UNC93625.1 glycosyltransferase [Candidatus Contubernalis alkalaceticus]